MITREDALTSSHFHAQAGDGINTCTALIGPRGGRKVNMEVWRANGAPKTWKTRDDVRVPIKYGMGYGARSYSYVNWPEDAQYWHTPEKCPLNN